jgi:hypothetical protein
LSVGDGPPPMSESNVGRKLRRLAEREARRKDGKQRSMLTDRRGKAILVYRAGRTRTTER